jgi:hypothetical protein
MPVRGGRVSERLLLLRLLVRRSFALELGRVPLDVGASAIELGALILAALSPPLASRVVSAGGPFVTVGGPQVPLDSLASGPRQLRGIRRARVGDGSFLVKTMCELPGAREQLVQISRLGVHAQIVSWLSRVRTAKGLS